MGDQNSFDFSLSALSPLDGRYTAQIQTLSDYFSEFSLIKYRLETEIKYFLFLSQNGIAPTVTTSQQKQLLKIIQTFSLKEAAKVKDIEKTIRHDVKAVEYFLREEFKHLKISGSEYMHFALTSEDINSVALGLQLKNSLQKIIIPEIENAVAYISGLAKEYKETPMLARTHGQPAIPTTLGKEFIVFAMRLHHEIERLKVLPIESKLSGAVGTWAAHHASFPKKDWLKLSREFIISLDLTPNMFTTQIVPADNYVRIFQSVQLVNIILIGFSQDMWLYISDGYFIQKAKSGEVGSSTMPQKVNPIDFENAEGNLGLANSLFEYFCRKLPVSRLQRDLSDSTVKRNIGVAFGYSLLAYKNLQKGLGKIHVNKTFLETELLNHWEIVTEGIQTVLRAEGNEHAYEKVKAFVRGKKITEKDVKNFIESLVVSVSVKQKLLSITPLSYIGLAKEIVELGVKIIKSKIPPLFSKGR